MAVIAEGVVLDMAEEDLAGLLDVEHDSHGHLRLAEVDLGNILKAHVQQRLKQLDIKTTIASKNIGYELRCADPIPMDMEYTRDLGYCAAKYLLAGGNAAMISMQGGHFIPVPFEELTDPDTGRSKVRLVDIASTRYAIARRYMIRLRRDDLNNPQKLANLAKSANPSPEEFRREFESVVANEPPPSRSTTTAGRRFTSRRRIFLHLPTFHPLCRGRAAAPFLQALLPPPVVKPPFETVPCTTPRRCSGHN